MSDNVRAIRIPILIDCVYPNKDKTKTNFHKFFVPLVIRKDFDENHGVMYFLDYPLTTDIPDFKYAPGAKLQCMTIEGNYDGDAFKAKGVNMMPLNYFVSTFHRYGNRPTFDNSMSDDKLVKFVGKIRNLGSPHENNYYFRYHPEYDTLVKADTVEGKKFTFGPTHKFASIRRRFNVYHSIPNYQKGALYDVYWTNGIFFIFNDFIAIRNEKYSAKPDDK